MGLFVKGSSQQATSLSMLTITKTLLTPCWDIIYFGGDGIEGSRAVVAQMPVYLRKAQRRTSLS